MIFGINLNFSCSILFCHLLISTYNYPYFKQFHLPLQQESMINISSNCHLQLLLNCYILLLQIFSLPQDTDQRATTPVHQFTSTPTISYLPGLKCKDMGPRPTTICKDTLDSLESIGQNRSLQSIICTDTLCKDTRHWLSGPLLKGPVQKPNRTHRAKRSLLALLCYTN